MSNYSTYKEKITSFCKEQKRIPGYKELQSLTGFKSKNAVFKLINKLVEDGVFEKDSSGKLSLKNIFGGIPMLGIVEAGIPTVTETHAVVDTLDNINLDDLLLSGVKGQTFLLEVKGDSMIDACIAEGDIVLVERIDNPRIGEIVIAYIDGGWTMKYYRKDKNNVTYLEPANIRYAPIYPEYELDIKAVVRAVIRKLHH